MPAYKFTAKRGQLNRKDVALGAGSAEAQPETLSVNIDVTSATSLRKRDVLDMLEAVKNRIFSGPWPPA